MQYKTQNISNIKIFFTLAIFAIAFLQAPHAEAARLYLDIPNQTYGVGDTFLIPIKLDTEGESINTVSADILFPDTILSVTDLRDNDSPISNWVDQPTISGNSITFSGIIPGGFDGVAAAESKTRAPGTLLWLVVRGDKQGLAPFSFTDAHAYLNDGLGTEALLVTNQTNISIEAKGHDIQIPDNDNTPPEPFIPIVTNSALLNDSKYTVVFSTTDKGSGVAYYEVSEGFGSWNRATSPYLLTDQTLRSTIRVRAVDHSGNTRLAVVGTLFTIPGWVFAVVFISVLALLYIFYYRYKRKLQRHHHE